jgi:ferric-dicitrate binding protein FerR (iron transport regulator)
VRQVWGDGQGRFRTAGRYASATVRGTNWLTADRCDGTFVRVRRGVVQVRDVPRRRQVIVRAGSSYLARP